MPCSKAAKMQNPLKFVGVPQTPEPISMIGIGRLLQWYQPAVIYTTDDKLTTVTNSQ